MLPNILVYFKRYVMAIKGYLEKNHQKTLTELIVCFFFYFDLFEWIRIGIGFDIVPYFGLCKLRLLMVNGRYAMEVLNFEQHIIPC